MNAWQCTRREKCPGKMEKRIRGQAAESCWQQTDAIVENFLGTVPLIRRRPAYVLVIILSDIHPLKHLRHAQPSAPCGVFGKHLRTQPAWRLHPRNASDRIWFNPDL